jgi:outer membrane protein assembly factor BamA
MRKGRKFGVQKMFVFSLAMVLVLETGYAIPVRRDTSNSKHRYKVIVLPAVIHSPETKWGFGTGGTMTFHIGKPDVRTRTSNIQLIGLYTSRHQTVLGLDGSLFFPNENYILRMHSSYTYYPDKYWGLGNRTDSHKPVNFSYKQFFVFPQLLRRVYKDLYAGISLEYQRVFHFTYDRNNFYNYDQVKGLQGGIIPGAGALITWDRRNNAFSPTKGEFLEFSATFFENRQKDYYYTNYIVDLRKYIETERNQVMAFQVYCNFNSGSIPILSLASMGGHSMMRGYYSGRFRDKNMVAAQVEYRLHVWKWFGLVGFAGTGQVTNHPENIAINQFKIAGGVGLRVALQPKERLNLRLDYGVARNSDGFYLTVAEAF